MRLAINAYFWNRPNTGSGQYTRQLVHHLDRLVQDLEITLVVPQATGEPLPVDLPPQVRIWPVPISASHVGKVRFEQVSFPRVMQAIDADIAHVPYWGSPLQAPVPVVVTVHDVTTLLVREYRRGLNARLYNALVSASAKAADHIITDSKASKQDITGRLAIPEQKITTIYLAAGPEYQPKSDLLLDMASLRKYDLPDSYVLYLGGYEIHKNVTTLLMAYTYVVQSLGEDYPLVLAGTRPEQTNDRYPDYAKLISQLGLEEQVHWAGYIDEEDKPAVYRGASSFAFLSRHEGFGLPPLEAMACGVPVVVSNCSSLPEVVGEAGFVLDPDDERQIGGSIIASIIQDELAADLKEKGLKQAADFSWERTATETLLVYDRLLS